MTAALKQSQQFYLPQLSPLQSFNEFIAHFPGGYIAHCKVMKNSFKHAVKPMGNIRCSSDQKEIFRLKK